MQIFYKELSLEEGFEVSALPKNSRIVAGREVSVAAGIKLYETLRGSPIKCWHCGCEADRWISCRGQNDTSRPTLNLFATKHMHKSRTYAAYSMIVMMTRDHIIPKAHGGVDDVANLRPGCEICNGHRGKEMSAAEQAFMRANPHLVSQERLLKAQEAARAQANDLLYRELQLANLENLRISAGKAS